ncbi:hypothetical protein B0H63DRAFT_191937 [Podospora didyma]|uniref:Hsp70 family chaperone n=1 Tax=Podospora didyma TaxID=330526 RepID=A0AAE0U085_9PEZI|nr:hypothetical protein B0H63DRAFT_191937 [Podospora didyma]
MAVDAADVVVSIDFGTTYTGVAWMTPKTPIQVISDWPGSGDRGERKVPTALVYNANGSLSSWGFMCADDDDIAGAGKTRREFFKIFIDPDTLASAQKQGLQTAPRSTIEAQQFAIDYLHQVYEHVKESIEIQVGCRHVTGGWGSLAVEFLFSVPTTWTSLDIINAFKAVISSAGFGTEGPRHTASVDLTEAEAAAVATLKTSPVKFNMGSLFLTVDAGGGTTDLALMQVTSADQTVPQMSSLHAVNGVGIGSTLIDRLFIRLVKERFAKHPDVVALFPPDSALRLVRSHQFRTVKHKFGERAYMQNLYKIPVEGLSYEFTHTGLAIENGRMVFAKEEIQSLFDPQIEGIVKKIVGELDWLKDMGHPQQVEHMVLSGGLGSSAYVRDKLQRRFQSYPHLNASNVTVVPCSDPQLVVVRGLLLDRQQRWETGGQASVLSARIARASYGVIVQEGFSPGVHDERDMRPDPYDGQMWAVNQIQWLIRKDDVINPNVPLVHSFAIRLGKGDTTRAWDAKIVVSQNDPRCLPRSMREDGAFKLCDVKSNLAGVQQEQLVRKNKRGKCLIGGVAYYICQFDVKVIVAPADLRFELWFAGQKFSGNHEPITVNWDEGGLRVKPDAPKGQFGLGKTAQELQ